MQRRQRLIMVAICIVVFVIGISIFNAYRNSFQKLSVTIEGDQKATANIYLPATYDGADETTPTGSPIKTITNDETVRLKKGTYIVILPKQDDYKEVKKRVEITKEPGYAELDPDYTDSKLTSLLQEESTNIQQAITEKYPLTTPSYQISPGKLYKHGDWYGTTLTYNNPSDAFYGDTVRLIARKTDGSWRIATNPPTILISKVVYPDIPGEVIDAVNNQ